MNSRVPLPVRTKVLELVVGISLKSTGYIKLPVWTKILLVADIFLVIFFFTCVILVTSLSSDGWWWWWYERRSRFWSITAHIRQKSTIRSLWARLVSPILYIILSNLICLLSNTPTTTWQASLLSHLTSFVYCLWPITQRLRVYCLPSALICYMSALLWLYWLHSRAHYHHMAMTAATTKFSVRPSLNWGYVTGTAVNL